MTLLLAHFTLLALISGAIACRIVRQPVDRILATVLLFWGNIVALCLALSCLGRLNDPAWFFRGSLLLGLATLLVVRRILRPDPAPHETPGSVKQQRSVLLIVAACGTLLPILAANLAIAATYEPNNYDSMTYHLPRIMYYLGQGSLAHFATADFRQVFYPFDYNLLQLPCFVYDAPLQTLNFLNVAMWAVAGLAVYRISRLDGRTFNGSLLAAWLTLTSTEVLAQATSTIIDLPSGVALVCAVMFALRWRESRRTRDALLAGLAASLSAGTKLTVAFFGPGVGLLVLVFLFQHWRKGEVRPYLRGVRAWVGPALFAGAFCAPFLIYNLKATGQLMTHRMDFTLNKPFSLGCALQTAQGYLVQIFCEPLGRFNFNVDYITSLNEWFNRHVFAHWNEAYAFSALYTIPPDLNEDHVFFGFAGPLFLVSATVCLWRDRRLRFPMSWIALLGLGWFATYFATNKWSLYNQRYFVPPVVLLGPCAAAVWDAGRSRFTRWLFYAVAATGLWFSAFYLVRNNIRPTPLPFTDVIAPKILPDLPPALAERLAAQTRINISSYGTNERIFPLMHLAKHQLFTSGPEIAANKYSVFSFWEATRNAIYSNLAYYASYTMVPVPDKRTAGMEFLGTVLGSADLFDYLGLAAHANDTPATSRDNNIAVIVDYNADTNDPIRLGGARIRVIGLNPRDDAVANISADLADGTNQPLLEVNDSDWTGISVKKPFKRLVIRVLDRASRRELGQGEIPFTVKRSERDAPPPLSPNTLFSTELISDEAMRNLSVSGLASLEGPYLQWDLPRFRWAKQSAVRITIPADPKVKAIQLSFSVRLQVREAAILDVLHNGKLVQTFKLQGRAKWYTEAVQVAPEPGENMLELRDRAGTDVPDWLAYLDQNPDVKEYVIAQHQPLEAGAQEHYETHGKAEGRALPMKSNAASSSVPPDSLYFVYRSLRVEGLVAK